MNKIKVSPPPNSDGTGAKLHNWLFLVNQYCEILGVTIPTDQVKYAVSLLTGKALTWWRSKSTNRMFKLGVLDWDVFKFELKNAFTQVGSESQLRKKLAQVKQTKSVQDYTTAFRTLILELGDAAPDEAQ